MKTQWHNGSFYPNISGTNTPPISIDGQIFRGLIVHAAMGVPAIKNAHIYRVSHIATGLALMGGQCSLPIRKAKAFAVAIADLFDFEAAQDLAGLNTMPKETQVQIMKELKIAAYGPQEAKEGSAT